ncbi:MAG: pilus assembly protein [Alphaproteobacteria bacterium]|nr:pilus assembly protein [Alphaproteobacteria bacterium]
MRTTLWSGGASILRRGTFKLCRFSKDKKGTTAIEFGLVAMPFFMFAFGIMLVGLKYFTENALEHAVESAARSIRTGQAQTAGNTLTDFRNMVCTEASSYITCNSKLVVHVQSAAQWADITPTPCLTGGSLTPSAGVGTDPLADSSGGAEAVVLVTACYEWDLTQVFALGGLGDSIGDMDSGSSLIQAVSTFRTEPYN